MTTQDSPQRPNPRSGARAGRYGLAVVAFVGILAVLAFAAGILSPHAGDSATTSPLPPPADPGAPAGAIVPMNAPDPFVFVDGGHDYLYTSGAGPGSSPVVPVMPFTDLRKPGPLRDAMPNPPSWTDTWIWTVDVVRVASHRYVMWFTSAADGTFLPNGHTAKCIGYATATSPYGPFTGPSTPAVCQQWGSIDAQVFTDGDGSMWLIWKEDSNADRYAVLPTTIWSQRLAPDGTTLEGAAQRIATSSKDWEADLIEAPQMVEEHGKYYLFYTGNYSNTPRDAIGYMPCAGPAGPCNDTVDQPLIATNSQGEGPGEEAVFTQGDTTWVIYSPNAIFGKYFIRPLAIARIAFGPQGPYVAAFDGAVPGPG